jgi:hypothetical protein
MRHAAYVRHRLRQEIREVAGQVAHLPRRASRLGVLATSR